MQGEHIQRRETVARAVGRGYQLAGLIRREWADLRFLRSGRLHARRHVARDQTVAHGILERLVKRRVDIVDRAWGEPAIEFLTVQCARVARGEGTELEASEGGLNMYSHYGLVTLPRS